MNMSLLTPAGRSDIKMDHYDQLIRKLLKQHFTLSCCLSVEPHMSLSISTNLHIFQALTYIYVILWGT